MRKTVVTTICDGCGKEIALDAEGNLPNGAARVRIDEVGSDSIRTLELDAECLAKLPAGTSRKRRSTNGEEEAAEPAKK
jgi:hypothetical protein